MNVHGLNVNSGFTRYEPQVRPQTLIEFSTAAFRFGHSLINGNFALISGSGRRGSFNLRDNFFFPFSLYDGHVDAILRGLLDQRAQQFDPFTHEDIRNLLNKDRNSPFGQDLVSITIQRGREHGIQGYTSFLRFCFNEVIVLQIFIIKSYFNLKLISITRE